MSTVRDQAPHPATYHQQDNDSYCGAACAQIVITSFGLSLLDEDNFQSRLYNDIIRRAPEPGLNTGPLGLCKALNCKNPFYRRYRYVCATSRSASALLKYMDRQIRAYGAPAVAMVYGKWHWVVVTGFKKRAGKIDALMIHNPWPPIGDRYRSSEGFPYHDRLGHTCGEGSVVATQHEGENPPPYVDRGSAGNHVSYDGWLGDYWEVAFPVEEPRSRWQGFYVAVCPGPPTGVQERCDDSDHTVVIELADPPDSRRNLRATPVTGDAGAAELQAAGAAMAYMLEHGLQREPLWAPALAGQDSNNPRFAEARSVNYSHKAGSYYLVWFTTQSGHRSVCARVDAQTGRYVESVAVPEGAGQAVTPIDPYGHQYVNELATLGGMHYDLSKSAAAPAVVWEPSDQSYSSFYPFYRYTFEDRALLTDPVQTTTMLHIRSHDGKAFGKPTKQVPNREVQDGVHSGNP